MITPKKSSSLSDAKHQNLNKQADFKFQLFIWHNRLMLIGPSIDTDIHSHHAAQISIGLRSEIKVRQADNAWQQADGFYVPPNVRHQLDSEGSSCAMLYLDPQSTEFQHLSLYLHYDEVSKLSGASRMMKAREVLSTNKNICTPFQADLLVNHFLDFPHETIQYFPDRRVQCILDWVDANLAGPIMQKNVAFAVGVSESWLSHHFSRAVGLPLRRYVLWRRLRLAIRLIVAGHSLTRSAHAAGFADSAHLTRTFRDNFGITPSILTGQLTHYNVVFMDE